MHFANKNLLSQMHQALDTQFVTMAMFKRYAARSPETRTFNSYMRRAQLLDISQAWSKGFERYFAAYLRRCPQYALSRYIAWHRRKKDAILHNFKQTQTMILEKLQQLRPVLPSIPRTHASTLFMQNEPILKTVQNNVSPLILRTTNHELPTGAAKNEPKRSQFTPNAGVPPAIDFKCDRDGRAPSASALYSAAPTPG